MATVRRSVLAGAFLFGLALAPVARAQNLVANPDFATNITSWTFAGPGSAAFSSLDVSGSPSSGSVLLTNTTAGVGAVYVSQCVSPIVGGNLYDIGASVRIPSGGSTGAAYVAYFFYNGAGCTGTNSGNFTPSVSALDTWTLTRNTNVAAPAGAVSLFMELTVSKTVAGGQIQANFDRAFVGPPGTTPVGLGSFRGE